MQSRNKQLVWIAIVLFFLALAAALFLIFAPDHSKQSASTTQVDPLSHETVSSPTGKQPDIYGQPKNTPLYLGFAKFSDYGLGTDQVDNLKLAFYRYSQTLNAPIARVSIDVDSIVAGHNSADPNSPFSLQFNVQFDSKDTHKARVEYTGINDVRLHILSGTGKDIFDSQYIYSSVQSD
jgi:flagellar basal body-associated protein FliL